MSQHVGEHWLGQQQQCAETRCSSEEREHCHNKAIESCLALEAFTNRPMSATLDVSCQQTTGVPHHPHPVKASLTLPLVLLYMFTVQIQWQVPQLNT
jgi:hypothetical protein